MIHIKRLLWLVGYFPVIVLELAMGLTLILTYPLVGAYYFVKNGSIENIPYAFITPVLSVDEAYKMLLEKIERKENKDV